MEQEALRQSRAEDAAKRTDWRFREGPPPGGYRSWDEYWDLFEESEWRGQNPVKFYSPNDALDDDQFNYRLIEVLSALVGELRALRGRR